MTLRKPLKKQTGVALITVLMVVALATFSVTTMIYQLQLDIRRTENTLYQGQALLISKLAEHLAKQVLIDDSTENTRDDFEEAWGLVKAQAIVFEDTPVEAEIIDLQGRFNLNNLNQPDAAGVAARAQFGRLLTVLEIPVGLENTIADFIDSDQNPIITAPGGAEDSSYQQLEVAYLTANQNMRSPSELRLMLGISIEDYETLLPFITALPEVTKININTASAEVLSTIATGVDVSVVQRVLDSRPFDNVTDFTSNKIFAGLDLDAKLLSVTTNYFLFKSTVYFGHIKQQQQVIFERQGTAVRSIMHAEGEI